MNPTQRDSETEGAKREDGGPAFPYQGDQFKNAEIGMTLRDYFAAKAMAAMLSNPDCVSNKEAVASHAYGYADAMIAHRSKS